MAANSRAVRYNREDDEDDDNDRCAVHFTSDNISAATLNFTMVYQIIVLEDHKVIEYIRWQILDICHDTDGEMIIAKNKVVLPLLRLYVHWLCTVNQLSAEDGEIIVNRVIASYGDKWEFNTAHTTANQVIQNYRKHLITRRPPGPNDAYMVDSCDAYPRACSTLRGGMQPTWSTIYDKGAMNSTCGGHTPGVLARNTVITYPKRRDLRFSMRS